MRSKVPRCPRCGRPARKKDRDFPFCSERCRLIDLGRWVDGSYRVPGEKVDPEAEISRTSDSEEESS